ncbi:3,4-dihydroxy-2-butanone-4-phosphate synthase [Robiginitomaculum antarcticum]|uniref:3,4-dihydroxy-2-butanone-4-phosphate synthase n=1 Tax=Robiginitomaculum antarcticum TaxID=437507 RepID=UPI0003770E04|nr:3,4-dihydroxy-2-butanone-4-phosphate synthase [Robiginitomaculum antarcticum]
MTDLNEATFQDVYNLATPEEIIDDARNGRMYILVDAEDRENEGDLIIPAQFATPDAINFMARFGRGLICLAMEQEKADELGLKNMSAENRSRFETAFTQSIEAREGVTTGISAGDRSHTIQTAIDQDSRADDIVTPGHMFPIIAKDGGVLVRTGHTEASVDISRMAGLNPSAVICEIMNDDGTMARLDDLVKFAQFHGLKIGTIEDLVAYRMKKDHFVKHIASSDFTSQNGDEFKIHIYRNFLDGLEHVALTKGEAVKGQESLVRVHKVDFAGDILYEESPRSGLIWDAMKQLAAHDGHAVLILIREGSIDTLLERLGAHKSVVDRKEQNIREYGVGAQMLAHQGVHKMRLITNVMPKLIGLEAYDLELTGITPLIKGGKS